MSGAPSSLAWKLALASHGQGGNFRRLVAKVAFSGYLPAIYMNEYLNLSTFCGNIPEGWLPHNGWSHARHFASAATAAPNYRSNCSPKPCTTWRLWPGHDFQNNLIISLPLKDAIMKNVYNEKYADRPRKDKRTERDKHPLWIKFTEFPQNINQKSAPVSPITCLVALLFLLFLMQSHHSTVSTIHSAETEWTFHCTSELTNLKFKVNFSVINLFSRLRPLVFFLMFHKSLTHTVPSTGLCWRAWSFCNRHD